MRFVLKIVIQDLMSKLKNDMIMNNPFFGHLITNLPIVYVSGRGVVDTFGVGKRTGNENLVTLYVNKDYVQGLYDKYNKKECETHLMAVLMHEMYHIIFEHLTMSFKDNHRGQLAQELSVNSYINRSDLIQETGRPAGIFPEDFSLPSKQSAFFYYNSLLDNDEYSNRVEKKGESGGDDNDGGSSSQGGASNDEQDNEQDGGSSGEDGNNDETAQGGFLDEHGLWEKVKDDPMLKEEIKDMIRKTVETCENYSGIGDLPGSVKEMIDKAFKRDKPTIPWQIVLKQFVASASESMLDYTMHRPSKRYGTRPGTKKEDVLNLAIGIDTSGSVSNKMISLFFDELYWISKSNVEITIFEIDTEIKREYPFSEWTGKEVMGRGGTDLEPLLREVSDRRFDALIFFTDMGTPKFEERYRIPTMWVLNNSYYNTIAEMPTQDGIFFKLSDDGESFEYLQE